MNAIIPKCIIFSPLASLLESCYDNTIAKSSKTCFSPVYGFVSKNKHRQLRMEAEITLAAHHFLSLSHCHCDFSSISLWRNNGTFCTILNLSYDKGHMCRLFISAAVYQLQAAKPHKHDTVQGQGKAKTTTATRCPVEEVVLYVC